MKMKKKTMSYASELSEVIKKNGFKKKTIIHLHTN